MRKFIWCFLLCACGGGIERATFVTDALKYAPSGRVELQLENVSATDFSVNLCLSQLRKEDGSDPGITNDETCDLEQTRIKPGARLSERKTMPAGVPAGKYRYEATITLPNGSGDKVLTPVFAVE